ncbi:hypothetical protein CDL12_26948 [Handroanthus impetiginosus]|uniref:Uncharacterized protein n=1 Tax=Handroanthus impetiginosus TaxID=429701 RepID=A0A2G9G5S8_9LAMI|nr:hypothetical protein CDL12_26948 [Handroanthus impetiginosus]
MVLDGSMHVFCNNFSQPHHLYERYYSHLAKSGLLFSGTEQWTTTHLQDIHSLLNGSKNFFTTTGTNDLLAFCNNP